MGPNESAMSFLSPVQGDRAASCSIGAGRRRSEKRLQRNAAAGGGVPLKESGDFPMAAKEWAPADAAVAEERVEEES
jgi:hypothetical protein